MHSLPLFHRISGRQVIVVGEGAAADAKRRLVERAGGVVVGEHATGAGLAFVVVDEPEATAARLRERGLLVNVADRPDLCDFTLPSVLERGPVLVAVASGGASAGLSKALRLRLEQIIPAGVGRLAEALAAARDAMRARWPEATARRRALDSALGVGGALDPLREHGAGAVDAWLEDAASSDTKRLDFTIVGDDPDDLTLRQARALGEADVVRHDPDVPEAILIRARADAERRPIEDPRADHGLVVVLRRG